VSQTEHEALHRDLGVYVLGALEPAERDRVERHLSGCVICRDELADLAVLPALLARLDEPTVAATAPPFAPVIERLADERRRARRRSRAISAVAAAFVAVAVLVMLAVPPRPATPAGVVYATADGSVTATVEAKPWGMAVHITAQDLPTARGYVAEAVARDGHRAQIATWSDTGRPVAVTGSCYLDADDMARVEIVDPAADEVVAVLTSG
jgi:predicted anti-sigma-YlaC factor YlaD